MVPCDHFKAFVRLRDKEVLQSIFHPFSIAASPALWVAAAWGRRIQLSNSPTAGDSAADHQADTHVSALRGSRSTCGEPATSVQ